MLPNLLLGVLSALFFSLSYKSPGIFFALSASPFLLWPDGTHEKIYLLFFAILSFLHSKLQSSAVKYVLLLTQVLLLTFASRPQFPHQQVDWSQYLASTNQLRGEHTLIQDSLLGRLFHNKLFLPIAFLNHSLTPLNPSYLFGLGDKNPESKSLWISPLPFTFLLLLLAGSWKKFRFWSVTALVLSALNNHHLYESNLIFFFTFITLGVGLKLDQLTNRNKLLFYLTTLLYLFLAIYFSIFNHV